MVVRTFVSITGKINKLVKAYDFNQRGFFNITTNNKKELDFYFDDLSSPEFKKVEDIVKNIQTEGANITLEKYQRVISFDEPDFEDKLLIRTSFGNVEHLTGFRELPVISQNCEHYNHLVYKSQNFDKLILVLWDSISWAEKFNNYSPLMIFSNLVNIIHIDLVHELREKGIAQGMELIPVSIEIPDDGKIIEGQYFWIHSNESIGNISGDVKLGKFEEECLHPEILEDNNLIETYSKSNYNNQDFCISNYFGVVALFISQRVYQFFKEKVRQGKVPEDMISFTPIDLV